MGSKNQNDAIFAFLTDKDLRGEETLFLSPQGIFDYKQTDILAGNRWTLNRNELVVLSYFFCVKTFSQHDLWSNGICVIFKKQMKFLRFLLFKKVTLMPSQICAHIFLGTNIFLNAGKILCAIIEDKKAELNQSILKIRMVLLDRLFCNNIFV